MAVNNKNEIIVTDFHNHSVKVHEGFSEHCFSYSVSSNDTPFYSTFIYVTDIQGAYAGLGKE